jgi:hypothetical protein
MAALGAALAALAPMALILLGITVAARLVLHFPRHARGWRQLALIPLHHALLLTLWCRSFRGRESAGAGSASASAVAARCIASAIGACPITVERLQNEDAFPAPAVVRRF